MAVGVCYGQRNAGETAAGAEVEDACALFERAEEGGYRQGMEHVVDVKIVYVAAGDHVDARVPQRIEVAELFELGHLVFGELA